MKIRDHSFRSIPPKEYNVVLQMTYEEVTGLRDNIRANLPDIAYFYPESKLYRLWAVLSREIETRAGRAANPGWINQNKSAIDTSYNETIDGPANSITGDDTRPFRRNK